MFFKDFPDLKQRLTVAATAVVATVLFSCKEELPVVAPIDANKVPTHIVLEMSLEQSVAGKTKMRVYASVMNNFTKAVPPYESFPKGINVKAFTPKGLLETEITANDAIHRKSAEKEQWEAYGDVVINNYIKGQTIETDTIYWDKSTKKIFTHCYVKIKDPLGFIQGYGLESDELARNAIIMRPFDAYGIIKRDSTEVIYIDTVNFIGPVLKKK